MNSDRIEVPAFARTGVTSPFGKQDARVDTFRVNGDVLEAFDRRAAALGKTRIDLLREVMSVVAFGADTVKSMHVHSVERVGEMLGSRFES
jgi:hypothetical protein